jgi:hypothetical protein
MALDTIGNISLILSITSLLLLIVGTPIVSGKNVKNLMIHGYLTIVALALETILTFVVMVPSLLENIDSVLSLSVAYSFNTWLHVSLGIFGLALGFAYVALWLVYSRSRMVCYKVKKWMMPTFAIWIVINISGALIHLLQFF